MKYFNPHISNTVALNALCHGTGIILKSHMPHKQSFSILDAKIGKIFCYWDTRRPSNLRPGFLVSYTLQLKGNYYIISNLDIVNFPYSLLYKHLGLLHFILELCDYFLPLHNTSEDLFAFLHDIYMSDNFSTKISIKSFLFKLLILLNLYPKNFSLESDMRNIIFSSTLKAHMAEENLHLLLDSWLLGCMKDNEFCHKIKSFKFLKELGIYG